MLHPLLSAILLILVASARRLDTLSRRDNDIVLRGLAQSLVDLGVGERSASFLTDPDISFTARRGLARDWVICYRSARPAGLW